MCSSQGYPGNQKTLLIRGFLRSSPISKTFLPSIAVIAARLIEINVFPSELIVDETAITGTSFILTKYFNAVRTDLKIRTKKIRAFQQTAISVLLSL